MSEHGEFEVWQDGMMVVGGSGPYGRVRREANHYGLVYGQDGPAEVKTRRAGEKRWFSRTFDLT